MHLVSRDEVPGQLLHCSSSLFRDLAPPSEVRSHTEGPEIFSDCDGLVSTAAIRVEGKELLSLDPAISITVILVKEARDPVVVGSWQVPTAALDEACRALLGKRALGVAEHLVPLAEDPARSCSELTIGASEYGVGHLILGWAALLILVA